MKPDENAAREYASVNTEPLQGHKYHAHLSGQQHILDTLAEMAKGHEKTIEDAAQEYGNLGNINTKVAFQYGSRFGFTLGQASMQGDIDELKFNLEQKSKEIGRSEHRGNTVDYIYDKCANYGKLFDEMRDKLTQRDATIGDLKASQFLNHAKIDEQDAEILRLNEIVEVMEKGLNIYAGKNPEIASWQRSLQFNTFDKFGSLCWETSAEYYANHALTKIKELRKKES